MSTDPDYEMSIKNDIVPTIAIKLEKKVDPSVLFRLPVDVLDHIFGLLYQDTTISSASISQIILDNKETPEKIIGILDQELQQTMDIPDTYNEREDIIAGILINVVEEYVGTDLKKEIERRLREINNIDKLNKMAQMSLVELEVALELRPALQVPENMQSSIRTSPTPRIIRPGTPDVEVLAAEEISQTNESPIVPFVSQKPTPKPAPQATTPKPAATPDQDKVLAERKAKVEQLMKQIEKLFSKAKIKLEEHLNDLEVLKRIHPDRLEKFIDLLKIAKKKQAEAFMDWFVISQQIEEIDVLVTHWQGIVEGAGVFRAAIPVARYDAILPDLTIKDLEHFIVRARRAVAEVQESQDINERFIGIEEIKELASDLMRKAIY
ncbi:MAG: hypothetical protein EAX96_10955 [Candidatus Lokiarchaeota archaeon]|nr:hypothetical protein [Candidatus Lokiarchaeota archaeon]